jgi:hypothetical protein
MIDKNTVFIIGAGASHPYGFPLGLELRQMAYSYAEPMFQKFDKEMGENTLYGVVQDAKDFSRRFRESGDQSIDWFLKKYPRYSLIGKFLILHHILQAENDSKFLEEMKPENKKQDWYWYLYNEMSKYPKGEINPVLFLENKIKFITFNYDRSLENFLFKCYSNGHDFTSFGTTALELFKTICIKHVYGKVAKFDWEREGEELCIGYKGYRQNYHTLNTLKDNIHLIDERSSKKNMELGKLIMNAERIFFLGFSYADENLEMLEIPKVLNKGQWIFGTAFGMTENEIKKIRAKFSPDVYSTKMYFEDIDCLGLLRKFL